MINCLQPSLIMGRIAPLEKSVCNQTLKKTGIIALQAISSITDHLDLEPNIHEMLKSGEKCGSDMPTARGYRDKSMSMLILDS